MAELPCFKDDTHAGEVPNTLACVSNISKSLYPIKDYPPYH